MKTITESYPSTPFQKFLFFLNVATYKGKKLKSIPLAEISRTTTGLKSTNGTLEDVIKCTIRKEGKFSYQFFTFFR